MELRTSCFENKHTPWVVKIIEQKYSSCQLSYTALLTCDTYWVRVMMQFGHFAPYRAPPRYYGYFLLAESLNTTPSQCFML